LTTPEYVKAACDSVQPIVIAKIHVQDCAEVYGQGACYATDPEPCDQTYGTCKARCAFNCKNNDFTHTNCATGQVGPSYEDDIQGEPQYNFGSVTFCRGLPQSSTVTLTFEDSPGCDYSDPYRNERPGGPDDTGYRLARFNERHLLEGQLDNGRP